MEMRGGFVQIHPGKQACLVVQWLTGSSNGLWPVMREDNPSTALASEQFLHCRHPQTSKGASGRAGGPLAFHCKRVQIW